MSLSSTSKDLEIFIPALKEEVVKEDKSIPLRLLILFPYISYYLHEFEYVSVSHEASDNTL